MHVMPWSRRNVSLGDIVMDKVYTETYDQNLLKSIEIIFVGFQHQIASNITAV